MGCMHSAERAYIALWINFKKEFEYLGYSEADIAHLSRRFLVLSGNHGTMKKDSFLLKFEHNAFIRKAFSFLDNSSLDEEEINFRQLAFLLWNFCSLSRNRMMDFVVAMCHVKSNHHSTHQVLSIQEYESMLREIHGPVVLRDRGKMMYA